MDETSIVSPVLASLPMTFRDPALYTRPQLTYTCAFHYRAWIHIIRLGVRMHDPTQLRDARNVLCRAFLDLGFTIDVAQAEAKAAVRRANAPLIVNGTTHRGAGAVGERFRVVAVDIGETRVVVVVPAQQREISVELPDL